MCNIIYLLFLLLYIYYYISRSIYNYGYADVDVNADVADIASIDLTSLFAYPRREYIYDVISLIILLLIIQLLILINLI